MFLIKIFRMKPHNSLWQQHIFRNACRALQHEDLCQYESRSRPQCPQDMSGAGKLSWFISCSAALQLKWLQTDFPPMRTFAFLLFLTPTFRSCEVSRFPFKSLERSWSTESTGLQGFLPSFPIWVKREESIFVATAIWICLLCFLAFQVSRSELLLTIWGMKTVIMWKALLSKPT